MTDDGAAPDGERESEGTWYERYSWMVFVLVALSGLVPAVQLLVDPLSGTSFFAGFGHPVPESILSDPNESRFLAFVLRWMGTVLAGGNVLTLFVALTAWRNGKPWAWLAMWYWPTTFAAHYLMYGAGLLKNLQVVWVALTVLVLASNFGRFFSKPIAGGS